MPARSRSPARRIEPCIGLVVADDLLHLTRHLALHRCDLVLDGLHLAARLRVLAQQLLPLELQLNEFLLQPRQLGSTGIEPQLRRGLAGGLRVPEDRVIYPPAATRWLRANSSC